MASLSFDPSYKVLSTQWSWQEYWTPDSGLTSKFCWRNTGLLGSGGFWRLGLPEGAAAVRSAQNLVSPAEKKRESANVWVYVRVSSDLARGVNKIVQ